MSSAAACGHTSVTAHFLEGRHSLAKFGCGTPPMRIDYSITNGALFDLIRRRFQFAKDPKNEYREARAARAARTPPARPRARAPGVARVPGSAARAARRAGTVRVARAARARVARVRCGHRNERGTTCQFEDFRSVPT